VLFDAGIAFLADRDILTIIADDFGPDLYSKGVNFDDGCIALTADRSLPFYKCNLDTGEQWLREALRSVNTKYRDLRIGPNDFAKPDIEWEPLPIDRNDPTVKHLTNELDKTAELVRADNGYNATLPEERELVLESLESASNKLKKSNTISWGYIEKNILEPTGRLLRRFKDTAIGIASAGVRAALETWITVRTTQWSCCETGTIHSASLRQQPLLQCWSDVELLDSLLDGRLLVGSLHTAQQRGWGAFDVVDRPGVELGRCSADLLAVGDFMDWGFCFMESATTKLMGWWCGPISTVDYCSG
jgi:hypothetical protein